MTSYFPTRKYESPFRVVGDKAGLIPDFTLDPSNNQTFAYESFTLLEKATFCFNGAGDFAFPAGCPQRNGTFQADFIIGGIPEPMNNDIIFSMHRIDHVGGSVPLFGCFLDSSGYVGVFATDRSAATVAVGFFPKTYSEGQRLTVKIKFDSIKPIDNGVHMAATCNGETIRWALEPVAPWEAFQPKGMSIGTPPGIPNPLGKFKGKIIALQTGKL